MRIGAGAFLSPKRGLGKRPRFMLGFARALTLTVTGDSLEWTGSKCPKGYDASRVACP